MNAPDFCEKAAALMRERGKQYDKPEGERSMGRTVAAFNAVTGRNLSESEGWLLMLLLKQVRQWQQPGQYHADSAEDAVAYSALLAESLAAQEPRPAPETLTLLPLVVGGVYRTRDGGEVSVTHTIIDQTYPFLGSNKRTYDCKGREHHRQESPEDLVERIR